MIHLPGGVNSVSSLRDIQRTIGTFWVNRHAREWLADGADSNNKPAIVQTLNGEVLESADKDGVGLYGRLIAYGHHDVMDSIFPFCSSLLGDEWHEVVEDYLLKYPPDHFNLNRICRHFSEYLCKFGQRYLRRFPFMHELADYEWMELEKIEDSSTIVFGDPSPIESPEQIVTMRPVVNPTLIVRHYHYPIPEIAARVQNDLKVRRKTPPKSTHLAIYRDPENHKARFLELGAAASTVVETAKSEQCNYQRLLQLAVSLTPELPPDRAVVDFLQLIEDLQKSYLFTGSERKE